MNTLPRLLKKSVPGFLFLIPWLLVFAIFTVYPFFYGVTISFFRYDFINMTPVGFQNYTNLFQDEMFINSIFTTLKMFLLLVPATIVISLWVSMTIMRWGRKMQAFTKVALYVPSVCSQVALVLVWKWMFSPAFGISTYLCNMLGIPPIDWFGNGFNALLVVTLLVLTFSISQPVILYSAALANIPETLFEAAEIDGAGRKRIFFSITWPMLMPTTVFVLITTSIGMLQVFAVPYLLTSGGPNFETTTILLLLYRAAFEGEGRYGYASAMGVILFILIAVIAAVQFKLTKSSEVEY